jgi:signal peptidase I
VKSLATGFAVVAVAAVAGCGGGGDSHATRAFRVPSEAMAPTFRVADHVLVDLDAYRSARPQRGDIVVFKPPKGSDRQLCGVPSEPADGHPCERPTPGASINNFMKRVVALPRDWLKVQNNHVFLGKTRAGPFVRQREPFIARNTPCGPLCNLRKPIQIPAGHVYVMGDNRGASDDSRDWGPVPVRWVLGKVVGKQ